MKQLILSLLLLVVCGCASVPVTDRRYVMDRYMEGSNTLGEPDINVENYREGAQGGTGGSAGGGCGCN